MKTTKFINGINSSYNSQTKPESNIIQLPRSEKPIITDFWLPYQWEWINDDSLFSIGEKGRRVGLSEAQSFRSVRNCLLNKLDTYYSTYNLPAAKNFIRKCAKWARAFNQLSQVKYRQKLIDESKVTAYRIEFLNKRFIEAISSNPNNFRDKEACEIVKDEAAFDLRLAETVEAVKATGMWGYPIKILSTHFGDQNEFNLLIQKIRKDPSLGRIHRVDFDTAIEQGLYKKICEIKGEEWSYQKQKEYVEYWYKYYGDAADQELRAIPRKYGGSKMFDSSMFSFVDIPVGVINQSLKIKTWDFAATSREKAKNSSFYTAYVTTAVVNESLVIIDAGAERFSPDEVEEWLKTSDKIDDPLTMYVLEEEPGSTGKFFSNHMERIIQNRNVTPYVPAKSKPIRAMPLISALKSDQIVLWEGNREKLDRLIVVPMTGFDGTPKPLVNDITDCVSMMFGYWIESSNDWIAA